MYVYSIGIYFYLAGDHSKDSLKVTHISIANISLVVAEREIITIVII